MHHGIAPGPGRRQEQELAREPLAHRQEIGRAYGGEREYEAV
jgi:hypothetical protein